MVRKKKAIIQPFIIKTVIIWVFAVGLGFFLGKGMINVFRNSDYFKIRSITIDPSLQFINKSDLRNLIGKNIFEIDLEGIQRKLSHRYPQASQLKVVKYFPNQVAVVAKERLPFVQLGIENTMIILDKDGVMLSSKEEKDKNLPLVVGIKSDNPKVVRGLPFRGKNIRVALEIVDLFQANRNLSSYSVEEINVENLSKIYFTLSNGLSIIVDQDKLAQKIRVLEVVLSQGKLDVKHVKYIDLRFKEPIIGKK